MTDPLSILFGSQARVKLLRFFLFNPSQEFTFDDISRRAKLVRRTARTEINALERADIIKKKTMFVSRKNRPHTKVRTQGYVLNVKFPQLSSLQTFLFETAPINGATVTKHMAKAAPLDFIALTGVFTREFDRRLDILIAAKKLNEAKIEVAVRALEAELGIEIRYSTFTSADLVYRVGMNDKLTRDVFDYPYIILTDKIGVRDELSRP